MKQFTYKDLAHGEVYFTVGEEFPDGTRIAKLACWAWDKGNQCGIRLSLRTAAGLQEIKNITPLELHPNE